MRLAAQEFAAAGFEAASLNRIIAAMSMSKSSFYHLLSSKQELFELAVADLAAGVTTQLQVPEPEAFAGRRFWSLVGDLVQRLTTVLVGNEDALLLGRMVYAGGAPPVATIGWIEAWVGRVLATGRETGQVRTDLPADLQLALVAAVLRALDEWSVRQGADLELERAAALSTAQVDLLHRMLATDEAPAPRSR